MLFQEPPQTPYDIKFPFLGFPVRVHPGFFILPVLLGQGVFGLAEELEVNIGVTLIVLALVFFVSILVHELGHTLAFRYFGIQSRILLYWFGGLAIPDSFGSWNAARQRTLTPNQQIIVSAAGPAAGFLLAGIFIGMVYLMGSEVFVETDDFIPSVVPFSGGNVEGAMYIFLRMGIWVNIFWNVLNLAPVFPLDGGQIARQLFIQFDPHNGLRNSLMAAVLVGALIAIHGFRTESHFMGFFFAFMAYQNYQSLTSFGGGGNPW